MKIIIGSMALVLLCCVCCAQRVDKEFDNQQAEREIWFYSQREFPLGSIPTRARINAIEAMRKMERSAIARAASHAAGPGADAGTWTLIGPRPTDPGSTYVTAGRINSIAIDPRDNNAVYIGAAEGGVWKTTDGGATWTPLTDDQNSLAMGAIALDPTNPDIVYAGTGEENFAQDSYYGAGILKSIDGGQTWTDLVGPFLRSRIGAIAIQPTNGQTLLCSSDTGLWRSTDGATSWTRVLTGTSTAVLFDPSNGNIAYAARGTGNDPLNGVYKSTDAGKTWTRINGAGSNSINVQNAGRIQLAIAPSNSATLFASVADIRMATSGALLGIWKSTDAGQTWNSLPIPKTLLDAWGVQLWYDNVMMVSPTDSNVLWAGGTPIFRSLDGGNTWQEIPFIGPNNVEIHVDQHFFAFTPDGTELYLANDGGIYRTTDIAAAKVNWTTLNDTLAITQFYPGFTMHPSDPKIAIGGSQDNGTQRYTGNLGWSGVTCGDGGYAAIDPSMPAVAYAACQKIAIRRSDNNAGLWIPATYGINPEDRVQFIAPMVIDPGNPTTLYFGTFRLWRSTDGGGKWAALSGDLTAGKGTIKAIAVAPSDSNTAYVGTSDGLIKVTHNAGDSGATWVDISQGLPPRTVTHLMVDPVDPATVYATFSGFSTTTDTLGHLFRTRDGGGTWMDMSGNLPNIPVNDLLIDPDLSHVFYAATDAGVMISSDDGTSWDTLGGGLPRVVVHSVALQRDARVLRAATHGRSVWEIAVPISGFLSRPVISSITPNSVNAGAAAFTLGVTGSGFGPNTKLRWNGQYRSTTVVDPNHIQAAIPANDVADIGRATVSVFEPGGGTSNSVNFKTGPAPASTSSAAVSAANPLGGSSLAQRSISTLYGTNLSAHTIVADDLPPLPFTLGGTTLTLGGNPVPLFFVSPGQINFQVPFLTVSRPTPEPLVITQGLFSTTITVTVSSYAPSIFTTNAQGSGQASALINGTASLPAPTGSYPGSRPIARGEFLALYGTGLGDVRNRPALGSPSPSDPLATTLTNPVVMLAGQMLDPSLVVFSGLAPGFVGLYQVNFKIPDSAPVGDAIPVTVTIGGLTSNVATIAIQ